MGQESATKGDSSRRLVLVGMAGGSGGHEAAVALLQRLGSPRNLSIVYIQQDEVAADDEHRASLAQATTLQVCQLQSGVVPAAGYLYCVPPGKQTKLHDNQFELTAAEDREAQESRVDRLLGSLAAANHYAVVGVVLSGNGTAGTLGIKAIGDAGGMTLAQAPDSAAYDSMPRSAAGIGAADHVLRPEEIAKEILRYGEYLEQFQPQAKDSSLQEQIRSALSSICDILRKKTDHNFKHYKQTT